jgi:uncharacterized membrane protein
MITAVANWFHLLGVLIWIGGMLYTLFVLRPSLSVLGEEKGKFVITAMGRFFPLVWLAIFLLLITGGYRVHNYIHSGIFISKLAVFGIMVLVFSYIYFGLYKKLDKVEKTEKTVIIGKITNLIKLNFSLGLLVIILIEIYKNM